MLHHPLELLPQFAQLVCWTLGRRRASALQTSSSSQRTHGRVIRRSYNREQKQLKALHMPKSEARCFIAHTSNSCRLVASSVPTICQLSSVTIFLS